MKKRAVLIGLIVVLMLVCVHLFADYDRSAVVKVMKANGALMGKLKQAAKAEDYFTAAEALMGIAREMKSLDAVTPMKGSKAEWDRIHNDLIDAAFKGIGACGEKDGDELNKYIGEISSLLKKGHSMFR